MEVLAVRLEWDMLLARTARNAGVVCTKPDALWKVS